MEGAVSYCGVLLVRLVRVGGGTATFFRELCFQDAGFCCIWG